MRSKSLTSVHHPLFSGSYVDTVPASNDGNILMPFLADLQHFLRAETSMHFLFVHAPEITSLDAHKEEYLYDVAS